MQHQKLITLSKAVMQLLNQSNEIIYALMEVFISCPFDM